METKQSQIHFNIQQKRIKKIKNKKNIFNNWDIRVGIKNHPKNPLIDYKVVSITKTDTCIHLLCCNLNAHLVLILSSCMRKQNFSYLKFKNFWIVLLISSSIRGGMIENIQNFNLGIIDWLAASSNFIMVIGNFIYWSKKIISLND